MESKAFELLLDHYILNDQKNRIKIKTIILKFFEALGNNSEITKIYRRRFSSIVFS